MTALEVIFLYFMGGVVAGYVLNRLWHAARW